MTINALARDMVMDRTTLGRNILPLQRDRLIEIARGGADRRSRELRLTEAGAARLRAGVTLWQKAQARFAAVFGEERAAELRALLHEVAASDFAGQAAAAR